MSRVLNARGNLADDGHPSAVVHYVVTDDPPVLLRDALRATGAVIERMDPSAAPGAPPTLGSRSLPSAPSEAAVAEIADRAFAALARRAANRVGSRDLAIALRMLEDQTFADPPVR